MGHWLAGVCGCFLLTVCALADESCVAVIEGFDGGATGDGSTLRYEQFNGRSISEIRFKGTDVFDPSNPRENNAFYRFLNTLHVNSRPSILKSSLLFQEGDVFNADLLAETERLLRSLPYLSGAEVLVEKTCQNSVALAVVTRDIWTTEPIFNFSREGGDTRYGFGFKEGNVLGYGNSVSLVYEKSQERSQTQYNFSSPHLFGTRMRMRLSFAENSDGQESAFELTQPFYSLGSRWAYGVFNVDGSQVEKIRFGDRLINAYKHERERHRGFVGIGAFISTQATHRFSLGISQDKDDYEANDDTQTDVPINTDFVYPWFEYQYIQNKYGVYSNLDLLHRVEDVPLGINFNFQLGYGGNSFGNDTDFLRLKANYQDVIGLSKNHIVKLGLSLDNIHAPAQSQLGQRMWGGEVQYYFLSGERHRYYAAVEYNQGRYLLQHNEFGAGGEHGLRGYPLDYQRGDRRVLLTMEKRYVTPWHVFNLMRIGAVAFVDAGTAWGDDYGDTPFLANVGVGLRFSSSKAKLDHIAHLDLATPLIERDSVDEFQLVMKVESHF